MNHSGAEDLAAIFSVIDQPILVMGEGKGEIGIMYTVDENSLSGALRLDPGGKTAAILGKLHGG